MRSQEYSSDRNIFRINCHELRSKLQQALLEESKSAQLKQIEEKKRLQQIEKDEEDMWLEVERRAYEAKLLRERTEQSIREERNASTTNYLNWQVANKDDGTASKLQAMEEEKRLNTLRMAEIKSSDAKKKAELEEKKREIAAFCKVRCARCQLQRQRLIDSIWFFVETSGDAPKSGERAKSAGFGLR